MATPFRLKRSSVSGKRPNLSDLQLGELALNFYDGYLFAERDTAGVGIGTTVALLTPWTENFGAASIYYQNSVAIGTDSPTEKLTVFGSSYVSENFNTKTLFASTITSNNGIFTSFTVSGLSTFNNNVDINAAIDVDGHTELDELSVTGVSTFSADLDINAAIDVDGHTELDELSVTGVSTFSADLDINAAIDVDGHTELDELNVSGVSTFNDSVKISGNNVLSFNNSTLNISHSGGNANFFNGGGDLIFGADGNKSIRLERVGVATLARFTHGGSAELYYNGSKKIETTNEGILVSGLTTTGTLSVTGVSTFAGNLDINAAIDVDGHTELDELQVTGVSTFTADLDINAAIDVDGHTELDELRVSGIATYTNTTDNTLGDPDTGAVQIDGGLGVNKNVSIGGALDVNGHTELDELNVAGVATFVSLIDANGGLDVTGHTELDNLNVTGIATIQNLDVLNNFDVFDATATFHNNVFIAGNLSIGGTATTIIAQDLRVFDKEITLGITTDAFGNDVSNDITANHGGIAIASTVGYPLVDLSLVGFSTLPTTYKQLMWVAANSYGIGTTDAWMFNYAVGIGSTAVPNNVRLAVESIQFTGTTISAPHIVVSGISTFGGDLDINAAIDVDGHTELDELRVTGVSTFTADLDINAAIDVDGHTELDELQVTGVSTFTADLDINAAIDVDGHTELDELQVTGVSTFTADLDINAAIDVDGHTELDELSVSGVSTFASLIDSNGGLDVTGHTELDNVNISGVTTFVGLVDANGGADITGQVILNDNLSVTGVSTFTGAIDANGGATIDNIQIGITNDNEIDTVTGNLTLDSAGGTVTIDDQLIVSGVSTFNGTTEVKNSSFKVTNSSASGQFLQITQNADGSLNLNKEGTGAFFIEGNNIFLGDAGSNETYAGFWKNDKVNLNFDNSTKLETTGYGVTIFGGLNVSGITTYQDTTNNTLGNPDTGAFQIDGGLGVNKNVTIGGGLNIGATLNVTGVSTFTADLDINAAIDVDGHTELDELNVSGVSTFSALIDSNGGLDVTGHTELDNVNISGVSTFAGLIDVNGGADVTGQVILNDNLSVTGVSTFNADLDINAAIDVDGHTELDELRVTGVSTFTADLDINAAIDVDGHTELDELRVTGISTFTADLDINAAIDVDGHTELDELSVSGVSTFSANLDINAAIDVDGHTELDELQVTGISTFTADLDINAAIDVDGHTELDELRVTGISTFTADLDINAAIDVDGHTELDELNVSGVSTFASLVDFNGGVDISGHVEIDNIVISGISTFSDITNNTLGDPDSGAVQIDGGLGINKNVTVGGNLDVQGYSNFVGVVTFRGGTINLGDADTDDINVGGEFISSLIPNATNTFDLGSTLKKWRNVHLGGILETQNLNVSGITTTVLFNVGVGGTVITTTTAGFVGINSTAPTVTLDVGGTINSSTDVTINGTSVLTTAQNDAVALAIALG